IGEKRRGSKRLTHPEVGDLDLDYEALDLAGDEELQLITWLAGDAATAKRLATLTGGPGGLRLVEGRTPQRGALPCLRWGSSSRLVRRTRIPATILRRVSAGSITSSMKPRSAAAYGLAYFS